MMGICSASEAIMAMLASVKPYTMTSGRIVFAQWKTALSLRKNSA